MCFSPRQRSFASIETFRSGDLASPGHPGCTGRASIQERRCDPPDRDHPPETADPSATWVPARRTAGPGVIASCPLAACVGRWRRTTGADRRWRITTPVHRALIAGAGFAESRAPPVVATYHSLQGVPCTAYAAATAQGHRRPGATFQPFAMQSSGCRDRPLASRCDRPCPGVRCHQAHRSTALPGCRPNASSWGTETASAAGRCLRQGAACCLACSSARAATKRTSASCSRLDVGTAQSLRPDAVLLIAGEGPAAGPSLRAPDNPVSSWVNRCASSVTSTAAAALAAPVTRAARRLRIFLPDGNPRFGLARGAMAQAHAGGGHPPHGHGRHSASACSCRHDASTTSRASRQVVRDLLADGAACRRWA